MNNSKKIYGGSDAAKGGGLIGSTDTDYFYFFCPKCPDKHLMRILEYEVRESSKENPYNDNFKKKAKGGFTIAFTLHCESCKHTDLAKISNTGWQGGTHADALLRVGA